MSVPDRSYSGLTMMSASCVAIGIIAMTTSGCGRMDRGEGGVVNDTIAGSTFISTESELIGTATDMTVAPDGRLYIADYALKHVLSVAPDGTDPVVIGREGSGPGEFSGPMTLAVTTDTVRVFDMAHGSVQAFTAAGAYVNGVRVNVRQSGRGRSLARDGRFAFATGGLDSSLVTLQTPDGERLMSIGDPVVPPITMWDFTAMKDQIRAGQVPDQFRNDALPLWLDDGGIALVFYAAPEVRKYGADGRLLWSRTLADPVLDEAFAEFVRLNIAETNPAAMYPLTYFADAFSSGDELWLLLNTEEDQPAVILILDSTTGEPKGRRVVQGVEQPGSFAIDDERRRLYISRSADASVAVVDLPRQ
jgi:hypothetical protein